MSPRATHTTAGPRPRVSSAFQVKPRAEMAIGGHDELMEADLVDETAPHCPSCLEPMDAVIGAWWCLECQEAVRFDPV
jgi:hypothetical protein